MHPARALVFLLLGNGRFDHIFRASALALWLSYDDPSVNETSQIAVLNILYPTRRNPIDDMIANGKA